MTEKKTKPPWFRMYSEVATDRKIYRAARMAGQPRGNALAVWLTVLCAANDSPQRGVLLVGPTLPVMVDEIADTVGYDEADVKAILDAFEVLEMIECVDGIYRILHWGDRQFTSDSSGDRVKAYRKRRKKAGMTAAPQYDSIEIIARDGGCCVYCSGTENVCVDHMYPTLLGGCDHSDNLAASCKSCNSGKAGRTPEQAGYVFRNKEAEKRYLRYLKTVTVTPPPGNGYSSAPETESEAETESSLSLNAHAREYEGNDSKKPSATDRTKTVVREVVFALGNLHAFSSDEANELGDQIALSVAAGHSKQDISQAYQEAFDRANGPVGDYARAILRNWAETGPPKKGVYGNGSKGFEKDKRKTTSYSGQGASGEIGSLAGLSVDNPIKEVWDPETGEEYYIDCRTDQRVTESGEPIVVQ